LLARFGRLACAIFSAVGELVVVLSEFRHSDLCLGVFHPRDQGTHRRCAIAPITWVVGMIGGKDFLALIASTGWRTICLSD
jgi:hypothetical protein